MERLLIAFQYCIMFVLKECLIFGIVLHHPPFDPCPKGWKQAGCASGTDLHEVLNIIIFDEEHE